MADKGIDSDFLHYGVRKDDLSLIKTICEEKEIDFEWFKTHILAEFHSKKVESVSELTEYEVEQIIEKAIQNIKQ